MDSWDGWEGTVEYGDDAAAEICEIGTTVS